MGLNKLTFNEANELFDLLLIRDFTAIRWISERAVKEQKTPMQVLMEQGDPRPMLERSDE